jgi:hypothetical protein
LGRLASTVTVLVMSTGCCSGWSDFEPLDLGVSADLEAVTIVDGWFLAAGSDGTVVAFTVDSSEPVAWIVADGADLHGVSVGPGPVDWWVVGDDGSIAFSNTRGRLWKDVALATTNDLYAIGRVGDEIVVVGDDLVRVRQTDGTWIEPPAPASGWGRLRAVSSHPYLGPVWAVGLDGVIVSAATPSGDWVAENSGTEADLQVVTWGTQAKLLAMGEAGTMVVRDEGTGEWSLIDAGIDVDFVGADGFDGSMVVAEDGRILKLYDHGRQGWELETFTSYPGARTVAVDSDMGGLSLAVVGEGGTAAVRTITYCGKV